MFHGGFPGGFGFGERVLGLSAPALAGKGSVAALAAPVSAVASARALAEGASWQPRRRRLYCWTVQPMPPKSPGG